MRERRRKIVLGAAAGSVCSLAHAQSKDPLPRTRDYIVALVRSHPAVDPKSRPVQKIEAARGKADPKMGEGGIPVFDHFVGDLHLRYVFDDPQFMVALHVSDLKKLRVDRDELPALAVANFRRLYPKVAIARHEQWLAQIVNGGGLEPSVMLDSAFWQQQVKAFGGEVIAAVPSTNEIYFTPREPKANVELLKHLAVLHAEKAGSRAVSRSVFGWRNFRWELVA